MNPFTIGFAVGALCGVFVTAAVCFWVMWPGDGYGRGLPEIGINIPPPPVKPPKETPVVKALRQCRSPKCPNVRDMFLAINDCLPLPCETCDERVGVNLLERDDELKRVKQ